MSSLEYEVFACGWAKFYNILDYECIKNFIANKWDVVVIFLGSNDLDKISHCNIIEETKINFNNFLSN